MDEQLLTTQDTALSQGNSSDASANGSTKGFLLDILETVAIAALIFFVIHTFIAQPHLVKGESMQPTYQDGEYILTNKIYNWIGEPARGDVVVFHSPEDAKTQFIKRIIALPGEKIKIADNKVTIYNDEHPEGKVLNESYLGNQTTVGDSYLDDGEIVEVPENSYFVMGDNRHYSYDSRSWGFVDESKIVGRAFFIYWPIPEFGFVTHAEYWGKNILKLII